MARWFRLYDDTLNDPKILKLSDKTHRIWIGILCVASKNDGALPPFEDMALLLRMKPEKLQPELEKLISAGLIDHDDNGLRPHNWQGRQYKGSSSGGTEGKKDSYVYVIGCAWGADALKIGFSKNPWARIVELQTAHHERLEVLAAFRCKSHSEVDIHELLKPYRRQGEWFALPSKIYVALNDAAASGKSYEVVVAELRKLLRSTTTETEADTETEKDSVAKATGAPAPVVPIDARTALFRDGLKSLQALTGKPEAGCRTLVGKWLRDAKDDAKAVHNAIRSAEEVRAADPVPWIERVLRQGDDDEIYRGVL